MKPMLAHRYKEHRRHLRAPYYVQPKLNGVRMLHQSWHCQSRYEEYWHPSCLEHIRQALKDVPENIVLDGELYHHGKSLQQINSRIAVNRTSPHPDESSIEYHIFDLLDLSRPNLDFSYRHQLLVGIIQPQHPCVVVETKLCITDSQAETKYAEYKARGYEGMMYRIADAPYGLAEHCGNKENRWNRLLKRKDFLDGEYPVVGVAEGIGQFEGSLGSLILELPNSRKVYIGTGYSVSERQEFWDHPPLGKLCRIKFEMLSDEGIPLKPVFEAIL
jgi:ATP-dependent DNA ligase